MSKNIPMYPEKNHNNCDSVLIQDIKNEKEELVLGCVKKGKNTVFTLYIPQNTILFRMRVPLQN